MTTQYFRPKPGIRDLCIFVVFPPVFINHFLHEFHYALWAVSTAIILVIVFIVLYFSSKVELIVNEAGIRQRLVYPLFNKLDRLNRPDRRSSFSVSYADIRHIEALGAQDTAYVLTISTSSGDMHSITLSSYADLPHVIRSIQRFHTFDATPVLPVGQAFLYLPKKSGHVLLLSIVLHAVAFIVTDLLSYWHPSNTGFVLLMAKLSPLTFLLVYFYIRNEWKQGAGKVFFLIAIVMCSALAWNIIAFNRYYTEHFGQLHSYRFVLENVTTDKQRWYLPEQLGVDKAYIDLYTSSEVDYRPDLPPYYVYAIQVKTGYLNDWVFAPDAFKNAKQLEMAYLKRFSGL